MPRKTLMIGAGIFCVSVFLVLGLLIASGGASKSRQFEVLGDLISGRNGGLMQILLIGALGGIAIGAVTAFTGVKRSDAAQGK